MKQSPPDGTDYCAFVDDMVILKCITTDPNSPGVIYPDGSSNTRIFSPIQATDERNYLCNATNDCGPMSNMLDLKVYGKYGFNSIANHIHIK